MANEDFTSKKTQIVGMKNPIKKVFRVREGGVTVTDFTTKKGEGTYTYDVIPPGTLLVIDKSYKVFPFPMSADGKINGENTDIFAIGYTINEVTPEKPQASVMTWGVINPCGYELFENYPINIHNKDDYNMVIGLTLMGIFVSFEADELNYPQSES